MKITPCKKCGGMPYIRIVQVDGHTGTAWCSNCLDSKVDVTGMDSRYQARKELIKQWNERQDKKEVIYMKSTKVKDETKSAELNL